MSIIKVSIILLVFNIFFLTGCTNKPIKCKKLPYFKELPKITIKYKKTKNGIIIDSYTFNKMVKGCKMLRIRDNIYKKKIADWEKDCISST